MNVCDGDSWSSKVVQEFGVREIPVYVLSDNQGRIVARGNNVEDMKRDVEKFLKKEVVNQEPDENEGGVEKAN